MTWTDTIFKKLNDVECNEQHWDEISKQVWNSGTLRS
jgi:hypothetical protein